MTAPRWFELRRYRAPKDQRLEGFPQTLPPTVIVLRDVTQARAARAARDAFMGVLSHELRTPITTLYGGSQLLERGLDNKRRKEVIGDMRVDSERLVRLVDDLLVMSRVERDMVETSDEPVLLQHLLASIIAGSPARWGGAHISLQHWSASASSPRRQHVHRAGHPQSADQRAALRQGRRERHRDPRRAGRPPRRGARTRPRAPGLPAKTRNRLFELFYRSNAARAIPGGAGIGLFVSRQLVQAMGGQMWAVDRLTAAPSSAFTLPIIVESEAGI